MTQQLLDLDERPTRVASVTSNVRMKLVAFAIASLLPDCSSSFLLGKGDGTFVSAVDYPLDNNPGTITSGDFDGDGKQDLATSSNNFDKFSLLVGKGDGTFWGAQSYPAGGYPNSVISADFNADGKLDLAVANPDGNSVTVVLNSRCR